MGPLQFWSGVVGQTEELQRAANAAGSGNRTIYEVCGGCSQVDNDR